MISISSVFFALAITSVSCRSLPDSQDLKPAGGNVIVLEAVAPGEEGGKKATLEGDKLFLEGKNFSSLNEMVNVLEDDKKGKSSDPEGTLEPFSIVVPVARNFSSLKELFEILSEDTDGRPNKSLDGANLSYTKGSEVKSSDYTLFFAP